MGHLIYTPLKDYSDLTGKSSSAALCHMEFSVFSLNKSSITNCCYSYSCVSYEAQFNIAVDM